MSAKIKKTFCIFLPLLIGGLVSLIIEGKIDYVSLSKPPFAPSSFVFPIAWTIIYLLMGLSYNRLIQKGLKTAKEKEIYYLQLGVNALWSIIFFYFKWRFLACIWIIFLDALVIHMISLFLKKDKGSAYLNIPYLMWILFATYLTIGIYFLNR